MPRFAFLIAAAAPVTIGSLALPGACWARPAEAATLPWDPTLYAIVDYLTGPALHTLAWIAFIAAAAAYALRGKFDDGVRRLIRMGVGIMLALHAVQIMNFLFG